MMGNMRTSRNPRFRNKPRRRQLKRTTPGFTQNGASFSRRDAVPQVRKFFLFDTLEVDNASTNFSFGLRALNINGSQAPFNGLITSYSAFYEQYRVKKVICRAQCGKGFTNDLRIKSYAVTRVDVDNQPAFSSLANLQSVLNSENTTVRTFTERGNILLGKYRPIQRALISNLSEPFLPNANQWYSTNDVNLHTWKGIVAALVIPETSILPLSTNITLSFEVDVEFRGRITPTTAFTSIPPTPPRGASTEMITTQDKLIQHTFKDDPELLSEDSDSSESSLETLPEEGDTPNSSSINTTISVEPSRGSF